MDLLAGTRLRDRTDERRFKGKPGSRRVVAAGAQTTMWVGIAGELQRYWARTETLEEFVQILFYHFFDGKVRRAKEVPYGSLYRSEWKIRVG